MQYIHIICNTYTYITLYYILCHKISNMLVIFLALFSPGCRKEWGDSTAAQYLCNLFTACFSAPRF